MEYSGIQMNEGDLTILNSKILNNRAPGFLGGGILMWGGTVYTRNSEFSGNTRVNSDTEEKVQIYLMAGTFTYNEATTTIENRDDGSLGIIESGGRAVRE